MYTIVGASGQVGAAIVEHLSLKGVTVKGIVRNEEKQEALREKGIHTAIADAFDLPALQAATEGTEVLFVLTPESPQSKDVMGETLKILDHYRHIVQHTNSIRKVVGLSSMGAEHATGTGNLMMSYMLEHAFTGLPVEQVFIRPAYYLSNWSMYLPVVEEQKIVPSFLPANFSLSMISPMDVAAAIADILVQAEPDDERKIYQLEGPAAYTPAQVAEAFSKALHTSVQVNEIPKEEWRQTLLQAGFSENAARCFCEMTAAVLDGKARPTGKGVTIRKGATTLQQYIDQKVRHLKGQPA